MVTSINKAFLRLRLEAQASMSLVSMWRSMDPLYRMTSASSSWATISATRSGEAFSGL